MWQIIQNPLVLPAAMFWAKNWLLWIKGSSSGEGGYVKGVVTITSLNKFKVQDVGVLEEKVIDMRVDEVNDPFLSFDAILWRNIVFTLLLCFVQIRNEIAEGIVGIQDGAYCSLGNKIKSDVVFLQLCL